MPLTILLSNFKQIHVKNIEINEFYIKETFNLQQIEFILKRLRNKKTVSANLLFDQCCQNMIATLSSH